MRYRVLGISVYLLAAAAMLWGQPGPGPGGPPPHHVRNGPMLAGPPGKWWDNPEMVKKLVLTADQQKKLDDIFQQSRLRLIDLHAALEKDEATLEPLMQASQLDDSKILPQIDRIAQARAELEKANARLLLAIRHVLTPEQWQKLEQERMQMREMPVPRRGGPGRGPGQGPEGPPPPPRPPQ